MSPVRAGARVAILGGGAAVFGRHAASARAMMPAEGAVREEARWWLEAAETDLAGAKAMLRDGIHNLAAFHAQQAAEKALKALLTESGGTLRTHACVDIVAELRRRGAPISAETDDRARELDQHYIGARYPNGVGGPPGKFYSEAISSRLLSFAEEIVAHARQDL